jgi:hypothetical protein
MLGERSQRHDSRGSDGHKGRMKGGHKGRMRDMNLVLHQSDTPFQRGRYYLDEGRESNQRLRNIEKYKIHLDRGSIPKESSVTGSSTKGRDLFPLMSKGER